MTENNVVVATRRSAQLPKGLRTLVIDPDPVSRFRLKSILRGMDSVESVSEMSTPQSLREFLHEHPVHIIFIDQFPGAEDAYEVIRTAREEPAGARARYILISEELDEEAIARGRDAGMRAFLGKPFDGMRVEKALFDALAAQKSAASRQAQEALKETLRKLRQVSVFAGFSETELVRLLRICKTKNFAAGTTIFREGDAGYNMYVVIHGQVDIVKTINDKPRKLVSMEPGDCFGEMAIISSEPRSADAVAATDLTLIEVNESVVNNNEDVISLKLVRQLAILLAHKLRALSK